MYGAVPSVTVTVASPSVPSQVAVVILVALNAILLSIKVNCVSAVQPFQSVTPKVYVPAVKLPTLNVGVEIPLTICVPSNVKL